MKINRMAGMGLALGLAGGVAAAPAPGAKAKDPSRELADGLERLVLYHPLPNWEGTPDQAGLKYEEVKIRSSDGVELDAWWLPADGARFTVLFSGGNAGNISHRLEKIRLLHDLGLQVLIYDYRGYGRSTGSPLEPGLYQDGIAAYRYLVETRKIAPSAIVLYGESLGSAVSAYLASEKPVGALVMEGAFSSLSDMAMATVPFVAGLVGGRFDTLSRMGKIRAPVLVLHSPQDKIVPFAQGERVFGAAPGTKMFVRLKGGHNDAFVESGSIYTDGIRDFLSEKVPRPNPGSPSAPPSK
jgi:fermentation-respiration switch protein FrsA (DUF1100 family)